MERVENKRKVGTVGHRMDSNPGHQLESDPYGAQTLDFFFFFK